MTPEYFANDSESLTNDPRVIYDTRAGSELSQYLSAT